jgi:hypothetical protein
MNKNNKIIDPRIAIDTTVASRTLQRFFHCIIRDVAALA